VVYSMVRQASDEPGRAVAILADLQGPKIRLGRFASGPVQWRTGDEVRVTVEDVPGTHDRVSTTYAGLARDAREGDLLLVDDGKVALVVRKVDDFDVVCQIVEGGTVKTTRVCSSRG
jgi:pyruvate kinase